VLAASIDQLTPGAAGRLSVKVRPVAVNELLLVSLTVNPIWEPLATKGASAVLVMLSLANGCPL
jgi:hypothetical protein